ncbi:MAG: bifunctional hydroxymethylpyrimidine kinase/phosphomethylpyrimidine kinase [Lysinibacillus sp.]
MDIVMTVAGSDSGGGAGIQADLKTFQELEVFGTSAITAVTAQNTLGVDGIFPVDADFVVQQMTAVFRDMPVRAIKTGMLFSADIIRAVSEVLAEKDAFLVIDPVMIAKGGAVLLQQQAIEAMKEHLLPIATVVTPNIPEASALSGVSISSEADMEEAASVLLQCGVACVVMKGGHLDGERAVDTAYFLDGTKFTVASDRIPTTQTHGTGCTFSAALTAFLGKGLDIKTAVFEAKKFVHLAISHPLNIGNGHGPTNHFAYRQFKKEAGVMIVES